MKVSATSIPGSFILEPRRFGDARGYFFESYHAERYAEAGIQEAFVQDNVSRSARGVLRGLHFQHPQAQGKLVQVLMGEVYDVLVDIRRGSPAFGKWFGTYLSSETGCQLYAPPGVAHAFLVTSDEALFAYKCTAYYRPEAEYTLRWNDPAIGIEWPLTLPTLSEKDQRGQLLAAFAPDSLPTF